MNEVNEQLTDDELVMWLSAHTKDANGIIAEMEKRGIRAQIGTEYTREPRNGEHPPKKFVVHKVFKDLTS